MPTVAPVQEPLLLSVVIPVYNEADNVLPLLAEIRATLAETGDYEVIFVDDCSDDDTAGRLAPELGIPASNSGSTVRVLRHASRSGQSAAVRTGVRAARGVWIATLDGDGQNDPAFVPKLLAVLADNPRIGLVAGQRVGRKDTGFKKFQSRIANGVRGAVLRDGTRDTGCGLKAFRRDLFLSLPYFDGLHRFLPALVRREGYEIGYVDVVDRQRGHGVSNYGLWDRLWVGILDLAGVWWLVRRKKRVPDATEIG
jgi:dolichol-phosphate mannosyltransferase